MGCHGVSADIGGEHLETGRFNFAVISKYMVSGFFTIKESAYYFEDGPNHLAHWFHCRLEIQEKVKPI